MDSKGHSVVITSFLPSQPRGNNEASHWLNSYTSSNNGGVESRGMAPCDPASPKTNLSYN